jgi:succinoglycan biosynthesis transport protein ExoP
MQSIQDLKSLIKRRLLIFLLASIPVFIIVTVVAFVLPPIYVSESTILIESQQIPEEYVKATVTGYVEERLQTITQRILSRSNLIDIINRFNLYPEIRKKYATELIIEKMRKNINLETIQAGDRRKLSTIAFTLTFEGKDPTTVQKIANVLASLYLEENLKKREAQATRTTEFLQKELKHIKDQIDEYGTKISVFKKAHIGELPEYNSINIQAVEQLNRDLEQANMQIRSLRERKVYLEGQLATMQSVTPIMEEEGEYIASPKERLKSLQLQLINLRSSLSEKHPDVVTLKREIERLEFEVRGAKDTSEKEMRLVSMKNELLMKKSRLGAKHPDVVRLSKEIAGLSEEIEKLKTGSSGTALAYRNPDSPAYVNLKTQLEAAKLDVVNYTNEKERIRKKIDYYRKKIENTPLIEKEYESLNTDYNNAKEKYNEIMSKLLEAEVARGMEETQHGERFTIIEAANRPEAPSKPNRLKIMLMGLFLSIGMGGGLAYMQESFDHSIKTVHEFNEISHFPVLSSIPMMMTDKEAKAKRTKMIMFTVILTAVICGALIILHYIYMPLDILWLKIQSEIMVGR